MPLPQRIVFHVAKCGTKGGALMENMMNSVLDGMQLMRREKC
jgi:hypothetical protein